MSTGKTILICGWALAALVLAVMLLLGLDQTGGDLSVVYEAVCAFVTLAILVGAHLAAFSGGHPKRIATVVLWIALLLFTAVYSTVTLASEEPRAVVYIAINILAFGAVSVLSVVLWSSATRAKGPFSRPSARCFKAAPWRIPWCMAPSGTSMRNNSGLLPKIFASRTIRRPSNRTN